MASEPGVRSLNVNGGTGKGKAKTTALRRAISPRSYLLTRESARPVYPQRRIPEDRALHRQSHRTSDRVRSRSYYMTRRQDILSLAVDHFGRDATVDTMFAMLGARKESPESDPEEVG